MRSSPGNAGGRRRVRPPVYALDSDLTTAFNRLDLELSEADTGVDLKKTRHFYLVELGLERLEEMDITEVTERLESKDSAYFDIVYRGESMTGIFL